MGFMDKLKQKAEEYDLQGKADKFAEVAEKTAQQAAAKAGELAHDNKEKVAAGLDKAGAKFDEQTDGKYTDKVAKAKEALNKGVDKVAEQRPDTPGTPGTPSADAPPVPPTPPPAPMPPTSGPQDAPPPPA